MAIQEGDSMQKVEIVKKEIVAGKHILKHGWVKVQGGSKTGCSHNKA